MISQIREWLIECPYLDEYANMLVEYLGNEPTEYSITEVPTPNIVTRYLDGTTERRLLFNFSSREYYGREIAQNIANSDFYKNFANWLEEKTYKEELPYIADNIKINSIRAITSGYLFQASNGLDNAKYNIQCEVLYTQMPMQEENSI